MTRDNAKALAAFIAAKSEIDATIARLTALSADHLNVEPDAVHWGRVGTLAHTGATLREISDAAFGEGEHAAA